MLRSAECGRLRQHGDSEIATFDAQLVVVFGMMAKLMGALVEMLRCAQGGARAIRSSARNWIEARAARECVNRKIGGRRMQSTSARIALGRPNFWEGTFCRY